MVPPATHCAIGRSPDGRGPDAVVVRKPSVEAVHRTQRRVAVAGDRIDNSSPRGLTVTPSFSSGSVAPQAFDWGFACGQNVKICPGTIYVNPALGMSVTEPLGASRMRAILDSLRADFGSATVISRRGNRIVVRWRQSGCGASIVVKMWSRPDAAGCIRRLLRISSADRERRNLDRLRRAAVAVPRALGSLAVSPGIEGYTDALFMEDLGDCEPATEHLKRLILAGENDNALRFEDALIEMAARILGAGMLDVDHGFSNAVVDGTGRAIRLDLELGRVVLWPRLFTGMYGEMVGRLIGLHAFAVQPDTQRSFGFAERVRERLHPPRRVLARAARYARQMMREQLETTGIDTRLTLPWDQGAA